MFDTSGTPPSALGWRHDWKKIGELVYTFLRRGDLGWDENEVVNIGGM